MLKLPRLSNQEFDQANDLIRSAGQDPDECPTCYSLPDPEFPTEREFGIYRYLGEEHECNCTEQIALRRHYTLARIPMQYMTLDWKTYQGNQKVKDQVQDYIANFKYYKAHGMGVEFYSVKQGVGKTFAATYVGKELLKKGYTVYFIQFAELVTILVNQSEKVRMDEKMRLIGANVLIIDEIHAPGSSAAQKKLFGDILEQVVRHRTNWNMPVITTTNLTHEDLKNFYPRIYSLLSMKQHQIEMPGEDKRDNLIREENEAFAANKEAKPIT